MRIVAKSTLRKFWKRSNYRDAQGPVESWYEEALNATWTSPQAIKNHYRNASLCGNNRVVFNVAGNKYRLVVEIQSRAGIVWVKFVDTHARYSGINVETINEYQAHPQ